MRIDLYTKTILTLILFVLVAIAVKPMLRPTSVSADSGFGGVQFSSAPAGFWAFDTKTGDVWMYEAAGNFPAGHVYHIGKLSSLGKPLGK